MPTGGPQDLQIRQQDRYAREDVEALGGGGSKHNVYLKIDGLMDPYIHGQLDEEKEKCMYQTVCGGVWESLKSK